EHPLARMVLAGATARGINPQLTTSSIATPGRGITTMLNDVPLRAGTLGFLESEGIAIPTEAIARAAEAARAGKTVLAVARGPQFLGIITGRDALRPEAQGVIADLRELGLKPILVLTGDRAATAESRLAELPLDAGAIHADLLPPQKATFVSAVPTAYVGDGLNDAPALAQASVGLAVASGTGTDVAAAAGDVVLLGEPLRHLPLLVRLSRHTLAILRQNILVFGFGVNFVGVIITAFLWPWFGSAATENPYDSAPLLAALYHQIGSLAVLLNSLRILGFERERPAAALRTARQVTTFADELLTFHWLEHSLETAWQFRRRILPALVLLSAIVWLLSGFTIIEPREAGFVERFGAPRATLHPGLHLRYPWPIETTLRWNPAEVRTVEFGFRRLRDEQRQLLQDNKTSRDLSWGSAHAEEYRRRSDESTILTGDGNLIEVFVSIQYTVPD
ncbi:MAG: HAD-IC family P-type ATPase, partial [Gemmataceae bacterium]